jgi:hypothetical protein
MGKVKRVGLSDKIRFEVFKRDSFTCQYCGGKAPDVVLNADHIRPVADGGTNGMLNLTTSCRACNSGKSDRILSDSAVVTASRQQAESIQERREQIRMLADWHIELSCLDVEIEAINALLLKIANRQIVSDASKAFGRSMVKKYTLNEVMTSIAISFDRYNHDDAWDKIEGILRARKLEREDPELSKVLRQFCAIARRFAYNPMHYGQAKTNVVRLHRAGLDIKSIMNKADETSTTMYQFKNSVIELGNA